MTLDQYIDNINQRYKLGNATEHTFRGDLQTLIESIVPTVRATNEPKRQTCGAPDYILTKKEIPVGFIEAKDIGDKDLLGAKKTGNKEQFDRYKASLGNLIFTDYLDFHLYIDGVFVTKIAIAEIQNGTIVSLPGNFATFTNLIKDFSTHVGQTIKNSKKLAEMMAGKARLLSDVIEKALTSDEIQNENSTLKDQMNAFKEILIHDITPKGFADVYAQTIAYGMFAARLHDPTLPTFSRQEAAELIPKSNPFLRKLFGYIAGPDIDDRIKWIVDSLVEIFLACNVADILKNYGKTTKMEDPIIHFYETFLSEYDPKLRKARGVWYTPAPVVNFIVRAVDDILKTEFDLPQGLADNSKTKIKVNLQATDKRYANNIKTAEEEIHRVQILDPATGTGTFLAEVVKLIYKKFEGQQGIWSQYVATHLLPRLNGFELLMASYAMAHLQLDLLLTETGYKPSTNQFPSAGGVPEGRGGIFPSTGGVVADRGGTFPSTEVRTGQQRLRVYLTNSLEESHPDTGTLFANWLSSEANEANRIKRDTPVMCIIGNPPYSGESANKGEWIMSLMEDYKKEPGGKEKLKEKNSKAINADEYKFIRYGQHFIEKNGSGVLAFINPHTFLDTPICRGMRWNLLSTFDKIYTIDLHGNSTKKETSPDGSVDTNVFDIMQGVSINIFVKTGKKKNNELGKVFHFDLFGKRELKYDFLIDNNIKSVGYKEIQVTAPNYYFIPKDFDEEKDYSKGFELVNLMPFKTSGIKTHDDLNLVSYNKVQLEKNLIELHQQFDNYKVCKYSYRPFDNGFIYYDTKLLGRAREKTMYHLKNENIGLILVAQPQAANLNYFDCVYITNCFTDTNMFRRGGPSTFPLYLYPATNGQQTIGQTTERTPNLNTEIVKQIAEKLDLTFTNEKETTKNTFAPIDILDYIYAVLHSPTYREKYKEFLKIDFPRVPYPKDVDTFWQLVRLGGAIRQIHLLESPIAEQYITQYPVDGTNVVGKVHFKNSPPTEGWSQTGVVDSPNTPSTTIVINNDPILLNPVLELTYNPKLKSRATELRKAENLPEVLFWMQVHKKKFHSIDFDRQRVIGNYIVDFYIKKLGLVVEIDGSSHDNKEEYDAEREAYLVSLGLRVYRVKVIDVMKRMSDVLVGLENYIIREYAFRPSDTPPQGGEKPPRPSGTPPMEGNVLGRVYINETQYFDNVPEVAWNFYIGGYQPAQKWLKDRKERTLEFDDILHYQKIIIALAETDRLMKEIDTIDFIK